MVMTNPYQTYKQNSVMTASGQELTLMLYNGCLRFIKLAKRAMEEKQFEEKNTNLIKAQAIIQELQITLNRDVEVADNMAQLYEYIYNRLIDANMKNDIAILEEAEGHVYELTDTWKQVIKLMKENS